MGSQKNINISFLSEISVLILNNLKRRLKEGDRSSGLCFNTILYALFVDIVCWLDVSDICFKS